MNLRRLCNHVGSFYNANLFLEKNTDKNTSSTNSGIRYNYVDEVSISIFNLIAPPQAGNSLSSTLLST